MNDIVTKIRLERNKAPSNHPKGDCALLLRTASSKHPKISENHPNQRTLERESHP